LLIAARDSLVEALRSVIRDLEAGGYQTVTIDDPLPFDYLPSDEVNAFLQAAWEPPPNLPLFQARVRHGIRTAAGLVRYKPPSSGELIVLLRDLIVRLQKDDDPNRLDSIVDESESFLWEMLFAFGKDARARLINAIIAGGVSGLTLGISRGLGGLHR